MARPRALDYEAKREDILQKSAELFARHGYPGASISMIADACGVSKALLYHYYRDKESVLFDVIETHLRRLVGIVEAAAHMRGRERLRALSVALLEAYRDADAHHQVQISSLKLLPPEKQEALRDLERRIVDPFATAIDEIVPNAKSEGKLKAVTMSLFGMLNWHYLWHREGKGLTREEYGRLAADILISGARSALK